MNSVAPRLSTERPPIQAMPATIPACKLVSGITAAGMNGTAAMPAQSAAVALVSFEASSSCTARACVARASSAWLASGRWRNRVVVRSSMRQRSSARSDPSLRQDMYADTPTVVTRRGRSLSRASIFRRERVLRERHVPLLLLDVLGRLLALLVQARGLGLERVRVRDDRHERRLEPVGAPDLVVNALEGIQVAVDRGVDLGGLRHEDHDVGRLHAQLDGDGLERAPGGSPSAGAEPSCTRACRARAWRHRRARRGTSGAPRLRRDVPELGHLRAEERVDDRRLARPAPPDEHERRRPLVEQHRAQRRHAHAQVLGDVERQPVEQLLDPRNRARESFQRVIVAGHASGGAWHGPGEAAAQLTPW